MAAFLAVFFGGDKRMQSVFILVQEDGKLIFSVRNPVEKKVQVTNGIVLDSNGGCTAWVL